MNPSAFNALILAAGRGHLEGANFPEPASLLNATNFQALRPAAQKSHAKFGIRHNKFDQRSTGRAMPNLILLDPLP